MGTAAVYSLLELAEHDEAMASDDDPTEGQFEIGGRTTWDLELTIGHLATGGDVQVVVEVSPTGDEETFTTLHDFTTLSSTGTTTESNVSIPDGLAFGVMRARVNAVTEEAWVGCTATAPFLDPALTGDTDLISKEVREFSDGATRLIERAESDVLEHAIGTDKLGKIQADLRDVTSYSRIRRAVARQAEHLLARHRLERVSDARSIQEAGRMGELADGLDVLLNPIMGDRGLMVWAGR